MNVFNAILPVITLLLGAGLTQLQSSSGSGRVARAEARQELAQMWKHVWNKYKEDSYTDLRAYQGQLRGYLVGARVPRDMVNELLSAMTSFWMNVEDTGDPEIGLGVDSKYSGALEHADERVWAVLDDAYFPRRKARRSDPIES